MSSDYCLVLSTCPDPETAQQLARGLIERNLAACVNIIPGLTSMYPWQGAVETSEELLLLIKTETDAFDDVEGFLKVHHPYELPEIIAVPVESGLPEYLGWITACLRGSA